MVDMSIRTHGFRYIRKSCINAHTCMIHALNCLCFFARLFVCMYVYVYVYVMYVCMYYLVALDGHALSLYAHPRSWLSHVPLGRCDNYLTLIEVKEGECVTARNRVYTHQHGFYVCMYHLCVYVLVCAHV